MQPGNHPSATKEAIHLHSQETQQQLEVSGHCHPTDDVRPAEDFSINLS